MLYRRNMGSEAPTSGPQGAPKASTPSRFGRIVGIASLIAASAAATTGCDKSPKMEKEPITAEAPFKPAQSAQPAPAPTAAPSAAPTAAPTAQPAAADPKEEAVKKVSDYCQVYEDTKQKEMEYPAFYFETFGGDSVLVDFCNRNGRKPVVIYKGSCDDKAEIQASEMIQKIECVSKGDNRHFIAETPFGTLYIRDNKDKTSRTEHFMTYLPFSEATNGLDLNHVDSVAELVSRHFTPEMRPFRRPIDEKGAVHGGGKAQPGTPSVTPFSPVGPSPVDKKQNARLDALEGRATGLEGRVTVIGRQVEDNTKKIQGLDAVVAGLAKDKRSPEGAQGVMEDRYNKRK